MKCLCTKQLLSHAPKLLHQDNNCESSDVFDQNNGNENHKIFFS